MTTAAQRGVSIDLGSETVAPADVTPVVKERGGIPGWRRVLPAIVCLAIYTVLGLLAFGSLASISGATMTGSRTADLIAQLWWLSWDHFALAHGHTPFFTDWQNYPVGMNFGINGSLLALGIPLSPLTAAFGPVVTWDVLLRLSPILSAFSMCLVLRRWTSWWPAAFVGGLLYGFGGYTLFNADGYLFLAFVPLPPIVFLLVAEIVERQRWKPVVPGVVLALVCGAQYLISSEILAATIMMATLGAGLYLFFQREHFAAKLRYMVTAALSALAAGVVTLGYPLWFTFAGPQHAHGPPNSPTALAQLHGDLLGLVVPGRRLLLSTPSLGSFWASHLLNATMMYLGLPLIVVMGAIVYLLRRRGIVVLAGAMAGLSLLLSLGSVLYVGGVDTHIPLPFLIVANAPVLEGLLSTRLSLFTDLFAAAIIAIGVEELHRRLSQKTWAGGAHRALAVVVPLLLVAVLALTNLPAHFESSSPTAEAAVFRSSQLAAIQPGSVLLGYPYPNPPFAPTGTGNSEVYSPAPTNELLLNQAVSGLRFKLVGGFGWRPTKGYYGSAHPSPLRPLSVETFFEVAFFGTESAKQAAILRSAHLTTDIRTFVPRYHVDTIVVLPIGAHPEVVASDLTAALGPPAHIDGAAVWLGLQSRSSP